MMSLKKAIFSICFYEHFLRRSTNIDLNIVLLSISTCGFDVCVCYAYRNMSKDIYGQKHVGYLINGKK